MQIKLKNNLGYVKIFNINISIMLKWKKRKRLRKNFWKMYKKYTSRKEIKRLWKEQTNNLTKKQREVKRIYKNI